MAERLGRPVAALPMGLATLVLTGLGGFIAYVLLLGGLDDGAAFLLVAGLVSLAGTVALLVVGVGIMRRAVRGRPRRALGEVFVTLVVAAAVFWGSGLAIGFSDFSSCGWSMSSCGGGSVGEATPFGLAAVCLVGGFGMAWQRSRSRVAPAAGAASGRRRRVWEPAGADLRAFPDGTSKVVLHLSPGTAVVEGERQGDYIWVTVLPEGQVGWLAGEAMLPRPTNGGGVEEE